MWLSRKNKQPNRCLQSCRVLIQSRELGMYDPVWPDQMKLFLKVQRQGGRYVSGKDTASVRVTRRRYGMSPRMAIPAPSSMRRSDLSTWSACSWSEPPADLPRMTMLGNVEWCVKRVRIDLTCVASSRRREINGGQEEQKTTRLVGPPR